MSHAEEISQNLLILGTNTKGEINCAYWETTGLKRKWNGWLFLLFQMSEDSNLQFVGPALTSF